MNGNQLPTYQPGGRGGTAEIFATVLGALKQGSQVRRSREEAELDQRFKLAEINLRSAEAYAKQHPEDPLAAQAAATANEQYRAAGAEVMQFYTPKKAGPLQQILGSLGLDFGKGRGKGKTEGRLGGAPGAPPAVPGQPSVVTAQVPPPTPQVPPPGAAQPGYMQPAAPGAIPPARGGATGVPDVAAIMATLGGASPAAAPVAPAPAAGVPATAPPGTPPTAEPEPTTSAEYAARQARRTGRLGEAQYVGQLAEAQYQAQLANLKRKVMDGTATQQETDAYYRATGTEPYTERYQRQIDEANAVLTDPNATPDQKAAATEKFEQASKARSASAGYYVRPPTAARVPTSVQEAMIVAGIRPDRSVSSLTDDEFKRVQDVAVDNRDLRNELTKARTGQAKAGAEASRARAARTTVVKSRAFQNILANMRGQMGVERDPVKGAANIDEARRRAWAQYGELRRRHPEAELPEARAYALKLYDGSPNPQARMAPDDIEVVLGTLAAEEAAGVTLLPPPAAGRPASRVPSSPQAPPGWTP